MIDSARVRTIRTGRMTNSFRESDERSAERNLLKRDLGRDRFAIWRGGGHQPRDARPDPRGGGIERVVAEDDAVAGKSGGVVVRRTLRIWPGLARLDAD